MPWYVRWVIGIGAWVTAVVLMLLGGAFVFSFLDLREPAALILVGLAYLAFGLVLLGRGDSGVFQQHLGVATSAAGAGLIAGGFAATFEELWLGFFAAVAALVVIVLASTDKTLQFLCAAIAIGMYLLALLDGRTAYLVDLAALATPVGLYLLLRPPRRDLRPTAIALLFAFPVFSVGIMDGIFWMRGTISGGTIAQILHIVLFLLLAGLHWRAIINEKARAQTLVFAIVATLVCIVLPPGGSAAMLILMVAFVIGSRPFAVLGAALQAQFIARYYYSLEMNLFDKSLLLMSVGLLLMLAWWFMQHGERRGERP